MYSYPVYPFCPMINASSYQISGVIFIRFYIAFPVRLCQHVAVKVICKRRVFRQRVRNLDQSAKLVIIIQCRVVFPVICRADVSDIIIRLPRSMRITILGCQQPVVLVICVGRCVIKRRPACISYCKDDACEQ